MRYMLSFYPQVKSLETLDSEYLAEALELCSQYTTISKVLGSDYHTGPFYGFISTDLSYIRLQAEADFLSLTQFFTQMLTFLLRQKEKF